MQPLPPPGSAPAPPPPPLFLFMAFHNVHSPMQAPSWLIDQQNQSLCETRRTLHAMVAAVDNVTTVIIDKLKEHNMHVTLTTPSPSASSNFVLFWFCFCFFFLRFLCVVTRGLLMGWCWWSSTEEMKDITPLAPSLPRGRALLLSDAC